MKKIIIITVGIALVLVLSVAFAQRNLNPENRCRNHIEKMGSELDLTENQKTQMESLFKEFRDETIKIQENDELTREEKKETFFAHLENHREKVEQILTEEKFEKLHSHHAEMKENGKFRRHLGIHVVKHKSEMNEELKTALQEKRSEFEAELSHEEKEQIASLRQQIKFYNSERTFNNGECPNKEVKKEKRAEHKDMMESLYYIIENHEESLFAIQHEIFELSSEFHMHGNMHNTRHPFAHHETDLDVIEELHFNKQVLHFLLIDTGEAFQNSSTSDKEYENVLIYPNPVNTSFTVAFELHQNAQVSIELLNKYGGLLEVLDQSQRLAGHNTFSYDVSFLLKAEVYFLKVSRPEIVVVEKFIKL